jgi:WD40 repeat protein
VHSAEGGLGINAHPVRESIERTVRQLGPGLKRVAPQVAVATLAAAAFVPILAPLVGLGAAGTAGAGLMGLVGGTGQSFLSAVAQDFLARRGQRQATGAEPTEVELREFLEKELLARLEGQGREAAALRAELSRFLQSVDAVETALRAAAEDVKGVLAAGLGELGAQLHEFQWMLEDSRAVLSQILAQQKQQEELMREGFARLSIMLLDRRPASVAAQPPEAPVEAETPIDVPSPYKGLEAFQVNDAASFFGRERQIGEMLARLAEADILVAVGPSGSGKSSLLRAGLVPAIWKEGLPGSSTWSVVVFTPGPSPLEELAARVAGLQGIAAGSLLDDLRADSSRLRLATRQALMDKPTEARIVLVVDQFEELFTLCKDEGERRAFIDAILSVGGSRAKLILGVRADFYGRCTSYPRLAAALQDNQFVVGAMVQDELRQAIEGPAAQADLSLQPGLVETILGDLGGEPGALPLLSHALLETFNQRSGRTLTLEGYWKTGGIREAIAKTADRIYGQLSPAQQAIARTTFLRLTELGQGTEDTRRRASREELLPRLEDAPAVDAVLTILADARLITLERDTVEVAHEALIREWPTLRRWLDEDREGLLVHRRLTEAAQEWVALGRDRGMLYRGVRLHAASAWADSHDAELNAAEREFVEASRNAERAELEAAQRRSQQLRIRAAVSVVLFFLSLGAAGAAFWQTQNAQKERRMASLRALAFEAPTHLEKDLDLALLLSVQAYRLDENPDTHSGLVRVTQATDRVVTTVRGGVFDSALTKDGHLLALGNEDGSIRLWDTRGGPLLSMPRGLPDRVQFLSFSRSGTVLAAADRNGTLGVWDVSAPQAARWLGQAPFQVDILGEIALSNQGETIAAVRSGGPIVLWRPGSTRQTSLARSEGTEALAFTRDRNTLVSEAAGTLTWWDVATAERLRSVAFSEDCCNRAAFDREGAVLGYEDSTMRVGLLDLRRQRSPAVQLPPTDASGYGIAVSPGGKALALGNFDGTVTLYDPRRPQARPQQLTGHRGSVVSVEFGGSQALSSVDNRGMAILRRLDSMLEQRPTVGEYPRLNTDVARINALAKRLQADPRFNGKRFRHLALSRDGRTFAFTTIGSDQVEIGAAKELQPRIKVPELFDLRDVEFSPTEGIMATVGQAANEGTDTAYHSEIRLWDVQTGAERTPRPMTTPDDTVNDAAFTPDGRTIVAGYDSGDLLAWDVSTGEVVRGPIKAHNDFAVVAISPDGGIVASGGREGVVKLWDLGTGEALGDPLTTGDPVQEVTFNAERKTLLALSESETQEPVTTVTMWREVLWDGDAASERLCEVAHRNLTRAEWKQALPDEPYQRTCPQWPSG